MPVIRVDDEVWAWLQSNAQPFEDTPNSVLRKLARLDTKKTEALQTRAFAGNEHMNVTPSAARRAVRTRSATLPLSKTPQSEFRNPILRILYRNGGSANRTFVLKQLEKDLKDRLTADDKKDIKSGAIRWQKTAEWEVSTMRSQGLLTPQASSAHGQWSLSSDGERVARDITKSEK
jgi:hypothetical protein